MSILIWSGGYDSTYILVKELIVKKEIETWSFTLDRIDENKSKIEYERRQNILEFLRKRGFIIKHKELELNTNNVPISCSRPQQHIWSMMSLLYAASNSTFLFGFHKKDFFWDIYRDCDNVRKILNRSMENNTKWEFPIQYVDKFKIVMDIISTETIKDLVWTCETPLIDKYGLFVPCGECEPCINLELAKLEAKLKNYKGNDLFSNEDCDIIKKDEKLEKK